MDPISLFQVYVMTWASRLATALPLGLAFGAGMVSTVNPCGFAMLPAYLSLFLGLEEEAPTGRRLLRALGVAGMVSLGFVALFGGVGLALTVGTRSLARFIPWAGLLTGVALVGMGLLLVLGRHISAGLFTRLGARVAVPQRPGLRAFFLFGLAYGVASLGCTLPVFLVVVGGAMAVQGLLAGVVQFFLYGLGMGVTLALLTLALALFRDVALRSFRSLRPWVTPASGVLVAGMGIYLVYYWLIKGGLLSAFL